MKFRSLDIEELELFKNEFIQFLAVNGIDAESWVDIKVNKPDTAEGIIDAFSDMVYTTVLRKIMYIDYQTKDSINAFQFTATKAIWIGVKSTGASDDSLEIAEQIASGGEIFMLDKEYDSSREEEMFELIKKGGAPAKGELFKKLSLAYAESITTDR